jgi:hypothetical protein
VDLPRGVRVVRPLAAAPRPEPAFFVGAFRRAAARFVEVRFAGDFFAEAFFAELDLGGLAWLTTADTLSRMAAECCSTSSRAARSPARPRPAALATLRACFLRNPAFRRSCSSFFVPIRVPFFRCRYDGTVSDYSRVTHLPCRAVACPEAIPVAKSAHTHAQRRRQFLMNRTRNGSIH